MDSGGGSVCALPLAIGVVCASLLSVKRPHTPGGGAIMSRWRSRKSDIDRLARCLAYASGIQAYNDPSRLYPSSKLLA